MEAEAIEQFAQEESQDCDFTSNDEICAMVRQTRSSGGILIQEWGVMDRNGKFISRHDSYDKACGAAAPVATIAIVGEEEYSKMTEDVKKWNTHL